MNSKQICIVFVALCAIPMRAVDSVDKKIELNCRVPKKAPRNIGKVIAQCQDEIQQNLIAEALDALNVQEFKDTLEKSTLERNQSPQTRRKRSFFNDDERRIAGCLLQCVFKRKNALNHLGYPTVEGLVNLYTEDTTDEKAYVLATVQAVHTCLNQIQIVIDQNQSAPHFQDNGTTCEVAFQVFQCVSEKIQQFCGQTP